MHVAHAFTIASDHVRDVYLRSRQVCAIRTEEDVAGIGQFHDEVYLRLGLDLGTQVWMDTGQHTQVVAGACRLVDGLCRFTQLLIYAATGCAWTSWTEDETINTDGSKKAGQARIVCDDLFSSCGIAEAPA